MLSFVFSVCSWQIHSFIILCQLQTGKHFWISPSTWAMNLIVFTNNWAVFQDFAPRHPKNSYIVPNRKTNVLFPGISWNAGFVQN